MNVTLHSTYNSGFEWCIILKLWYTQNIQIQWMKKLILVWSLIGVDNLPKYQFVELCLVWKYFMNQNFRAWQMKLNTHTDVSSVSSLS